MAIAFLKGLEPLICTGPCRLISWTMDKPDCFSFSSSLPSFFPFLFFTYHISVTPMHICTRYPISRSYSMETIAAWGLMTLLGLRHKSGGESPYYIVRKGSRHVLSRPSPQKREKKRRVPTDEGWIEWLQDDELVVVYLRYLSLSFSLSLSISWIALACTRERYYLP